MQTYSLTIITVCYNALDKLPATIESVLAHKNKYSLDIEHLIVDGASTDGTPNFLVQWKNEGKIEAYISEPDKGIYDAMNKGIGLSRGKVLYFLNADDTLSGEDLSSCVMPILNGETQHCAASVIIKERGLTKINKPLFQYLYLITPCCHQGYFASAELYRLLGGYDNTQYKCIADGDFICKACQKCGLPIVSDTIVAHYPNDGFSRNCGYTYLPEFIKMQGTYWAEIEEKSKKDKHYAELISFILLKECYDISSWINQYSTSHAHVDILLAHIKQHRHTVTNYKQKMFLWWAEKIHLQQLFNQGRVSNTVFKITKWLTKASAPRPKNPYMRPNYYPYIPFIKSLATSLKRKLFRVVTLNFKDN